MDKFWVVLSHTYISKIKSKSFLISTAIMLAIVLLLSNLSAIIDFFDDDKADRVAIIDDGGQYYETMTAQLKLIDTELEIVRAENEAEAKEQINSEEIKGYLIISEDKSGLPKGVYKSDTISNDSISGELEQALTNMKNMIYTETKLNISQDQIATLYQPAGFEKVALTDTAKTEQELNAARGLVYVLLFVIYIGVISYAGMIASEVAGEKTSRVMEILVSSVSPVQQMFGKIMGIALVSMTQMGLFLLLGYVSLKRMMDDLPGGASFLGFGDTSVSTIVYAVIFALLGYLLYATLAAFLGSLVSRVEDVQSMISPMTWLVVIGFMLAIFGLENPEAGFVTVTSYIPPFTPMLMFLRVGMLELPFWEIALGIGLLTATILFLAIFGARVYRGGVLMYGQGTSFKNIKKAIELTKKG
ncbi:MAG: ABC transporter permease [Bacillus sp. (in: firmicutes)]